MKLRGKQEIIINILQDVEIHQTDNFCCMKAENDKDNLSDDFKPFRKLPFVNKLRICGNYVSIMASCLQSKCRRRKCILSRSKFTRPKSWSLTSQTIIILFLLLTAPFITDILRRRFTHKYVKDDDGILIPLPRKMTSSLAEACNPPGSGPPGRPRPNLLTPLVLGQKVPNVSEKTIGASGPKEGRIFRDSERFSKLKESWNMDVVYKNDENDREDRRMTERCRDSLNRLAILVSNEWEGVKVRVIEAWKEDQEIVADEETALHYEGRALDITTSDFKRERYGMLARLAVQAGFDWVYYKSRNFIHCSCKSESLDEALYEGCFAGDAMVSTPDHELVQMSDLSVGDEVLAVNDDGEVVTDKILSFMDQKGTKQSNFESKNNNVYRGNYHRIETVDGNVIRLTGNHLVFTSSLQSLSRDSIRLTEPEAIFAKRVKVGQYLQVKHHISNRTNQQMAFSEVRSVEIVKGDAGAYAPLTTHGTILVNGVKTSCYAVLESHRIAHIILAPIRIYHTFANWFSLSFNTLSTTSDQIISTKPQDNGIGWYSKFWLTVGSNILPSSIFQGI